MLKLDKNVLKKMVFFRKQNGNVLPGELLGGGCGNHPRVAGEPPEPGSQDQPSSLERTLNASIIREKTLTAQTQTQILYFVRHEYRLLSLTSHPKREATIFR